MVQLGRVGLWIAQGAFPHDPAARAEAAAEVEQLGFSAVWLGGPQGAELAVPEALLAATERLVVGTSIASIWTHDAEVLAASHARVQAAHDRRFVLGLGVSHGPMVEGQLGQRYDRPLAKMAAYVDVLDAADPPVPVEERLIAALGPKALELAAARFAGTVPYFTTPEHTAIARAAVGAGKLVIPEQKVVLSTDPEHARRVARMVMHHYFGLPNYVSSWRRLGFSDDDVAADGSDRLVDALIAWGDEAAVAARIQAHLDAGADQVAVQVLSEAGGMGGSFDAVRGFAPVLDAFRS